MDSTRTKALVAVYLISGLVGSIMIIAIAGLLVLGMLGQSPFAKIDVWPWLPIVVGLTIVAKYGAKWSARRDDLSAG